MGTISEAIRAVKEYIQEFGWTQGNAKSGDSVCLVQAISETTPHRYEPQERVEDVISLAINEFSIVSWNDEPGRTKDQSLCCARRGNDLARSAANTLRCFVGTVFSH